MLEENIGEFIDVFEQPYVRFWLEDLISNSPSSAALLLKHNKDNLVRFFGKAKKNPHKEWGEVWSLMYKNQIEIKILSSKKSGSMYLCRSFATKEDFKNDALLGNVIIDFLTDVHLLFSGKIAELSKF